MLTARVVPLHPIAHVLAKLTGRNCVVRGRCALPLSELERRVTRKALMVWAAYCAFRDKDGTCWPSRETVAEVATDFFGVEVTAEDARVALRSLKRVGLVRDIRWLPLKRYRKVYYREVRGRVFLRGLAWFVSVPDKVERAVSRSKGWGGARSGAGRPKFKSADVRPVSPPAREFKSAMSSTPLPPLPPLPTSRPPASQEDDDRSAVVVDLKEDLGFLPPDSPPYAGLRYVPGTLGIHRRPSEVLGRPATVPAARPFTEEELADDGLVVHRMRQAFEGAVRAVAGRRPSSFMRPVGAVTKLKMKELARRLSQIGASPESWFLFSANCWKGRGAMPLAHALSERRLVEQGGWFKSVCHQYACARVRATSAELELSARHSRMIGLLWHRLPQTEEGVREVVERCFPGDSWDRMVDRARREIAREQASIDARVAGGEFVWVK